MSNLGTLVIFLPPATKLGQGYIFTGVCDSVHRRGGTPPGQVHPPRPGTSPWAGASPSLDQVRPGTGTPPLSRYPPGTRYTPRTRYTPLGRYPRAVHAGRYGQQAGGTHPTGMHSCSSTIFAEHGSEMTPFGTVS